MVAIFPAPQKGKNEASPKGKQRQAVSDRERESSQLGVLILASQTLPLMVSLQATEFPLLLKLMGCGPLSLVMGRILNSIQPKRAW
jgi:hypothetical protein